MTKQDDRAPWDKGPWYDSDNPTRVVRGAGWRLGVGIVVVIAFFAIIGGIWWGISVATSGVKGRGDVVKQNNGATNRINSQAYFEQTYSDIRADKLKLVLANKQSAASPNDAFLQTNATGLYNTCVQAVTDYDQASAKTLFHDWKTADLPQNLDATDWCPSPNQ